MKQIPIIDSLRAFAAISVCLFHFICTTIGLFFPNSIITIFNFGQYGVHVFFIISGFIIPYSMYHSNYKISSIYKFLAKRFIRLEPPYIISILLILCFILIKHHFKIGVDEYQDLNANRIFLHLGYLINFFSEYKWLNNIYWTLAIEFQYYLFIAITYVLFFHSNIIVRYSIYIVCFLIAYFVPDIGRNHFPAYAPFFLIGIVACLFMVKKISSLEFWLTTFLCLVYNAIHIEFLIACIGLITMLLIVYFSDLKLFLLTKLGKISYSLYLIHPIIGASIINLLSKHTTTLFQKFVLILIAFIITLVSSYIMYLVIEKPSKKLSSKIKL